MAIVCHRLANEYRANTTAVRRIDSNGYAVVERDITWQNYLLIV